MTKRRLSIFGSLLICFLLFGLLAFPSLKRRQQSVNCANQMHAILYVATREWPADHNGYLPSTFLSLSNELIMPQLVVCPSDTKRRPAQNWSAFTAENCTYDMVTPGLHSGDTNSVFIRCPIHHYRGYADDRLLDDSGELVRKFP